MGPTDRKSRPHPSRLLENIGSKIRAIRSSRIHGPESPTSIKNVASCDLPFRLALSTPRPWEFRQRLVRVQRHPVRTAIGMRSARKACLGKPEAYARSCLVYGIRLSDF